MTEYIYIKFTYEEFGYQTGDVVKAELVQRDDNGSQVNFFDQSPHNFGALITGWSDLGGFYELNEMELIAYAATGKALL